jgi:site-specific recombinase XerD
MSCEARNLSQNTIRGYRSDLAQLLEIIGNDAKVSEISHSAIRSFLASLFDSGKIRASVRRKLAAVKSLFRWIDEEGLPHDARILILELRNWRSICQMFLVKRKWNGSAMASPALLALNATG